MGHDMNNIHTKKKDSIATESKPCRNINLRQSWKHNCLFQADEDGERFEQARKLAFKDNIIMILMIMIKMIMILIKMIRRSVRMSLGICPGVSSKF